MLVIMERKCLNCRKPIPKRMRTDAKHCSDHCRYAANDKRRKLPAWVRDLEMRLVRHAPAEAIGYRLGLIHGRKVWYYPPRARASLRHDGSLRLQAHFSLVPFEAPIVPVADLYGVLFYDLRGRELPAPPALAGGVEALPLRLIRIEDGDLK